MDLGEVAIVFGDRILRGIRAIKEDEQGTNAFGTPRIPPIGQIGVSILLTGSEISRAKGVGEARMFTIAFP